MAKYPSQKGHYTVPDFTKPLGRGAYGTKTVDDYAPDADKRMREFTKSDAGKESDRGVDADETARVNKLNKDY